jgi:hypothetical protein
VAVDAEEREGGDAERTQGTREVLGDGLHVCFADAGARRISGRNCQAVSDNPTGSRT